MTDKITMTRTELFEFAYDVYYKAITLISIDDKKLINIDEEIVKEIINNRLQSFTGVMQK